MKTCRNWRLLFFFTLICFLLLPALPRPVHAGEPTEQVRQTVEKVREIFKDENLKKPENRDKRKELLSEVVGNRFDYEEMSKRSLALNWKKRTPEERKEFVSLFSDLLDTTYLKKIERYQNEDIEKHEDDKVLYQSERIEGRYASVKTTIVTYKGTEIPVEYRLLNKDGEWKAYDVVIEGVSIVSNYRSQFNKIIRSESYEELVKKLRKKTLPEE